MPRAAVAGRDVAGDEPAADRGVELVKVVLAVIDTPLIYASRMGLEKWLGIEHDPSRAEAPLA